MKSKLKKILQTKHGNRIFENSFKKGYWDNMHKLRKSLWVYQICHKRKTFSKYLNFQGTNNYLVHDLSSSITCHANYLSHYGTQKYNLWSFTLHYFLSQKENFSFEYNNMNYIHLKNTIILYFTKLSGDHLHKWMWLYEITKITLNISGLIQCFDWC